VVYAPSLGLARRLILIVYFYNRVTIDGFPHIFSPGNVAFDSIAFQVFAKRYQQMASTTFCSCTSAMMMSAWSTLSNAEIFFHLFLLVFPVPAGPVTIRGVILFLCVGEFFILFFINVISDGPNMPTGYTART